MGVQKQDMAESTGKKKLLTKPKPNKTEYDSNLTSFDDLPFDADIMEISFGEECWTAADPKQVGINTAKSVSEEEDCFKSIWDINVSVSEYSAPPSEAQIIPENSTSDSYKYPKEESEYFSENWGQNSYHAPAALVEGRQDVFDFDAINNSDLLKYAVSECEIAGFQEVEDNSNMISLEVDSATATMLGPLRPIASTNTFIHHTLLSAVPGHPQQESPPYLAVAKKSKPLVQKKVGRPERETPLKITEVPMKGSVLLTPQQVKCLKYRRMRDLNNEASKKCRQRRRMKQGKKEQVCQEEEEKNMLLRMRLEEIETEVEELRIRCKDI